MSKATTFLWIMFGMSILFWTAGIMDSTHTGLGSILEKVTNFRGDDTSFWDVFNLNLKAVVGLGAGILIGGWIYKDFGLFARITLAGILLQLTWDYGTVINVIKETSPIIAILFFIPLAVMWTITLVEWVTQPGGG